MLAFSPVLSADVLSVEELKLFAIDMYGRMQRDWWATAYWAGIWTCGFVVTFLLIRMLFTRWGDRDVTKKTLGLSLLVHALSGMLSTTVMFGTAAFPEPTSERVTGIRRVIVDGDPSEASEKASGEHGKATPHSRAWERAPKFDSQQHARIEREPREVPGDAATPQKHEGRAEPISIPLPDVAERAPHDEPLPGSERLDARLNRPADPTQTPIAEETAQ